MIKVIGKSLCMILPLLLISGCWDQKQVEKRAYVYAIGLDKSEKENRFKITYLIVNPEYGTLATGGSTDAKPFEIISFETPDLITSRNLANVVVAKEVTYDLLKVFLVSEELAKDENFIRWIYDATKDREIRRDNYFIVTKENATDFLKENDPKLETRIQTFFNLILERGIETGVIPNSELHRFFKITEADADLFLAIYGTTRKEDEEHQPKEEDDIWAGQLNTKGITNKTQFLGSAVFKEGKMIAKLTGEETRISVLLNDTLDTSDILTTYPDPFDERFQIAARIVKRSHNKVKMNLKNGPGEIDVTVPLTVEILSDHSMTNIGKSTQKREKLKRFLEEKLSKKIAVFIKKTQEEFKGEPFGWSLIARKQFLTIPEYEQFDWMKSYPNMKVNVKVDIHFGKFGKQGEVPKLEKVRD